MIESEANLRPAVAVKMCIVALLAAAGAAAQTSGVSVVAYAAEELYVVDGNCQPTGVVLKKNLAPPLPAPVLATNRNCVKVEGRDGQPLWFDKMEISTDQPAVAGRSDSPIVGRPTDHKTGGVKGVGP